MASLFCLLFGFFQVLLFLHGDAATYWGDVEVLKQFKNGVNPGSVTPGSCLSSWDFAADPCDSLSTEKFTCGFRCDVVVSSAARVTEVVLDRWGYSGSLAGVSWNLPYLQTLDLSGNYFDGPIPASLVNLTRLRRLSLSHNLLSGWIPSSLGSISNLEELYLDNNNLEGAIPWSFNGLGNLKTLELQDNRLTGEIPDLGELNSLNFIDVSNNQFSGEIPVRLPPSLIQLTARNNSIKGNIPASISGLFYLQVLDLSHNNLTGAVPAPLFAHPALQQLTLSYNHYTSVEEPDPNSFQSSQLIAADLTNNDLRGFLPGFLGLLPRLSSLSLENNKLSGIIPVQYALKVLVPGDGTTTSSQFERLLLGGNYLIGAIPGPFLDLKPGSVTIRLGDNCLYRCPLRLFLCEGGEQKSLSECKAFGPIIP
ncbi:PREDICTED: probably inactive leucine-rich repeat receptor-like protein kinase At2g25790 [Ipomoea nil]|uniref:probably inactive leucine-rich repeat receptor-like protein kinase At2g25790 n=1 Tax=Ipomoea nil TaxID=35883 RepID=UPI000900D4C8|nr:PREDICTED: probably inactive leucine-rich repeat receptor-like protein kinase At2g25790 [Ipomoea nil]